MIVKHYILSEGDRPGLVNPLEYYLKSLRFDINVELYTSPVHERGENYWNFLSILFSAASAEAAFARR